MPTSSSSEEDLSAFASVAVDSSFIHNHAKSNKRAKRRVTNDGEKDTSQPVLASVAAVLDARLANELVFEERDDEHVNAATTPCEQPQPKRKKKRKGAHDEDVHVTQNNVEHNGAKKKKSKGNAKEKDPKQKKKKKTRDRQHVEDPADGGANTTTDNHTTIDNMGGVRLFRKVPPGVPCRLDIVNRPCTDPLQHKGVDRPPGRQSKGTQRHGRAGPTSDDDDDSDDPDARLLQVVVDATAIYKSAERAAKEAAANISNELIDAVE